MRQAYQSEILVLYNFEPFQKKNPSIVCPSISVYIESHIWYLEDQEEPNSQDIEPDSQPGTWNRTSKGGRPSCTKGG